MSTLATQRFAEALLASQSGIELMELGATDSSLKRFAADGDSAALAQALGRDRNHCLRTLWVISSCQA